MKRSSLKWILAVVIVAVACVAAYFIARAIVQSNSTQLRGQVQTTALAGQTVEIMGNGIVYYDGISVHALDSSGRRLWSFAAGANADLSVGDGGVAVWSGDTLSLLSRDNGAPFFSNDVGREIIDAHCSTYYTAIQVGDEHDSDVIIIDSSGRQVDVISFPSLTLLRFGFFNNGSLFWAMALNTQGTTPICTISTYRPGRMLAGTISDTSQVLYEVVFRQSSIRAVGTIYIKSFSSTATEITSERTLVYGWYLMSIDETSADPLMLFVPNEQSDGSTLISDVRMIRGLDETAIRLGYPAIRVSALGDTMYAFANQYLSVARTGSEDVRVYTLPIYVDNVLGVTNDKVAVVLSGGYVYLMPLPN